ncbi:META domain-containing protein [Methylocystis parvus]|uniref:META domain-containing protein n=1 Tax=Methylocystis parvus TaxID=134 RepID=A0A6B8M5J1_9HYPH|nr:META domain-containing protein [Methylocystis parvus]QGM97605.1 META domain-containing protein [Methylocystis parvus]WBJ98463.1 META domain-containing protein [Methylocystis parvus OBBP]
MRLFAAAVFLLGSLLAPASFAAPTLTGRYRVVAIAGADGLDAARTHAEFATNGRFASTIGCNRIAGAPTIAGSDLTFGPMATTRMACPPPLDQVERAYLEALRNVRGYRLSGETLLFLGEDGEALVTLKRAK